MNVIKNNKVCGKTKKRPSAAESIYRFFISMHFSLFLLALIATGSIFGTFIKQGGAEEEYISLYSENTYKLIKFFNLEDAYHSTWFYALIALFAANLVLCTARQTIRLVREKRRTEIPGADRLRTMECNTIIPRERREKAEKEILKAYRLVREDEDGMLFEKGVLSRWGVFVTHVSIIIILIGGIIGSIFGFRGFVVLGEGEIKDSMITEGANPQERALGFAIKCKNFNASFYQNGTPKDYVSAIEIIEGGKVILEKNVRVNDPLYYRGTRIYQSGYGQKGSFEFRIDGEKKVLAEKEALRKRSLVLMVVGFKREIHNFGPGVQIVYMEGDEPKTTWFLLNAERLRSQRIQGVDIHLVKIQENPYTSLEVTGDPGIFIVWTGFALILFGLYVTFFTCYRRIFIVSTENEIIMAGYALKNKAVFRREFEKLEKDVLGNG